MFGSKLVCLLKLAQPNNVNMKIWSIKKPFFKAKFSARKAQNILQYVVNSIQKIKHNFFVHIFVNTKQSYRLYIT